MASHLERGALNVGAVREFLRKELVLILEAFAGPKALVFDPALDGPLGLIAEVELLKKHSVEQIFTLQQGSRALADCACNNVLFFVRPQLATINSLCEQVQYLRSVPVKKSADPKKPSERRRLGLFMSPRRQLPCEQILNESGCLSDFAVVSEFHLDLVPFDSDVLSMEWPSSFREMFVEGDPTVLGHLAAAVHRLQCGFGLVPHIIGKGNFAHLFASLLMAQRRQPHTSIADGSDPFLASQLRSKSSAITSMSPDIQQMIVLDRAVDLLTPMLTQTTFEVG